jgi:hypothetical protein
MPGNFSGFSQETGEWLFYVKKLSERAEKGLEESF